MNGDNSRPVYLYPITEIQGNLLKNYIGNTKEKILFEDVKSKSNNIKYNQTTKELTVFDGVDYAIKYLELKTAFDQLKTELNNFITVFNAHVHTGVTTGGGSSGLSSTPGVAATADMTNSKVEKVRLP